MVSLLVKHAYLGGYATFDEMAKIAKEEGERDAEQENKRGGVRKIRPR
jgi:hypothetical protein